MIDIKFIRQNPQEFDQIMINRGSNIRAKEILLLDEEKRKKTFLIQELQAKRNELAKSIAVAKQNKQDCEALMSEAKTVNQKLIDAENDFSVDQKITEILLTIPNLLDSSTPIGKSEEDNQVISTHGQIQQFDFEILAHDQLGENLAMLDFEQSSLMSGSRFSTLSKDLARLERALANFMLDHANQHGYQEISPPNLVKTQAMQFCGQLPKFADEAFSTIDGYWLIPTAEVSLVNLVAKKILTEEELPLRFVAYTPCFRREAGSAGKDTRGIIRQHQFKKVELVSITTESQSNQEHERMTTIASEILEKLELPFRKILLCSADIGFCSQKTYDLEVWLPSQQKYREISSCSNCGDFQARRSSIRYKDKNNKTQFVHTLNGSALAVGRTLVAVLENYQNADGSISIPKVLQNYFGSQKKITC